MLQHQVPCDIMRGLSSKAMSSCQDVHTPSSILQPHFMLDRGKEESCVMCFLLHSALCHLIAEDRPTFEVASQASYPN